MSLRDFLMQWSGCICGAAGIAFARDHLVLAAVLFAVGLAFNIVGQNTAPKGRS